VWTFFGISNTKNYWNRFIIDRVILKNKKGLAFLQHIIESSNYSDECQIFAEKWQRLDDIHRKILLTVILVSPLGIAMLPAGLCFTEVTFFFKCRPSHSTTDRQIATRIFVLTPLMKTISTTTNLVNFGPVTPGIVRCICMGGECREADIRTVCWLKVIR